MGFNLGTCAMCSYQLGHDSILGKPQSRARKCGKNKNNFLLKILKQIVIFYEIVNKIFCNAM